MRSPAAALRAPATRRSASRVLQVVLSLQPGGTEHLVIEICRRLRRDYDVAVCCLDDEGAWAPDLRSLGIDVIAFGRRPGFQPRIGLQIAALAKQRGANLLHCHQYSPFVYSRIAAWWRRGLKLVYTEHGRLSDAPPSWKRRIVNPLLSRPDGAIVAVSHELRSYMCDARFPGHRVSVIHNGIEPGPAPSRGARRSARFELGIDDDTFVAASVARLDAVKDLQTLLEAFAHARRAVPQSRLLIVGDGPERPALVERAARADLAGAVDFLGLRPDVRKILPAADLYVNSSISEGVSITILEAMAAGLPVVATAAGGNPEILAEGRAGVLVPVRDPVRLGQAIAALATEPGRRATLATAGRRRLESSFTIERMVNQYAELYDHLLGS